MEQHGPWIQLKAFCVTAMFALALAFAGAGALGSMHRRPLRWVGWLGALVIAGVVLYGNAIIYHDTSLAPVARYRDLAAIGQRYAGQGPALIPLFDEYAEYFLRDERATDLVNPAYSRFPLAPGVVPPPGGVSFSWALNQVSPQFVETFPLIITARSPVNSHPPSNYELVERTRYFEVWRRKQSPAVLAHFPLAGLPHERTEHGFCGPFVGRVRRAGPGVAVAYVPAGELTVTGVPRARTRTTGR